MTYQPGRSSTLPWLTTAASHTHTSLPTMEPLQPKPMEPLQPKTTTPATQRTTRKRQARPGPQARRASKRETHAKLVQSAQEQPRDSIGRFAEKGSFLTRLFDPTPHAPTRLKQLPSRQAGEQKHPITAPPRARISKRRRKKPVPERGVLGRIIALFNGDYAKWRRNDLRQRAKWRMQAEGHYVPPPKKRTRRRRKNRPAPAQPLRKRGIVRRLLGL